MTIFIAADHAGFELKEFIRKKLSHLSIEIQDFGPESKDSVDYPDYAQKVCQALPPSNGTDEMTACGILICGSGQGMAMAANKFSHVRAALCYNEVVTALSRQHNNANVICLGSRELKNEEAYNLVLLFLKTPFEGGRHGNRVLKIHFRP